MPLPGDFDALPPAGSVSVISYSNDEFHPPCEDIAVRPASEKPDSLLFFLFRLRLCNHFLLYVLRNDVVV